MNKFGFLLVLLLAKAEEHPEPIFRAAGEELEMGYCFGVDYITLYKLTETGKQLLGNSSNTTFAPPGEYRDRVSPTNQLHELLGMAIVDLRLSDSGTYLRECWRDNQLVNHHEQYLYVCDEEVSSQEIFLGSDGGADLVCNVSISRQKNASVRWFKEANAVYRTSMFLDTKRSQEPLDEELKGVLQVRDRGFSLHLSEDGLKNNDNFYCLVLEGEHCKTFQSIQMPDSRELGVQPVFSGVGERVVLSCSSEDLRKTQIHWETPFGRVDESTPTNTDSAANGMYISKTEETGDSSLVIPSITLNHSGEYVCSTVEYIITVCSEMKTDTFEENTGNNVTLTCTLTAEESTSIQWYRKTGLQENLLIYDSGDPSWHFEANMHVSDTSLTITELSMENNGTYWCVVLMETMAESTDYPEDEEDDESEGDYNWLEEDNTDRCILKQVTHLKVLSKNKPTSITELDRLPDSKSESDSEQLGTLHYAVIGGVVGLVVVMVIVGIVAKLRALKREASQSRAGPSAQQKESSVSDPLLNLNRVS